MGFDTVTSGVSIENTSDMWLSPFSNSMVGQCAGPTLHSSSCKVWKNGLIAPLIPGSSSALANSNATLVFLSSGRLDRASCVAASGAAPRPPPPPAGAADAAALGPLIIPKDTPWPGPLQVLPV